MVWSNQAPNTIVIPPGATTGQRIEINATGVVIYDSANKIIYALSSNSGGLANIDNGAQIVQPDATGKIANFWYTIANAPSPDVEMIYDGTTWKVNYTKLVATRVINLGDGGSFSISSVSNNGSSGWSFGLGDVNQYYYEEYFNAAGVLFTNAVALTVNVQNLGAVQIINDYSNSNTSAWVGTTWTCPFKGKYKFHVSYTGLSAASYSGEMWFLVNGVQTFTHGSLGTANQVLGTVPHFEYVRTFAAGDTVSLNGQQGSGANQTAQNFRVVVERVY